MQNKGNNLKDISNTTDIALKDNTLSISYTKVSKLITALYMVTDIIDQEEPLRTKLRKLGADVISDIQILKLTGQSSKGQKAVSDIEEILSFLNITKTLGMISEMNSNILKKEFKLLQTSIQEAFQSYKLYAGESTLSDFFLNVKMDDSEAIRESNHSAVKTLVISKGHSIGHKTPTRIGVQKGSTLMQALSDKMSFIKNKDTVRLLNDTKSNSFLKGQRRDEIVSIIKDKTEGVTISDIKSIAQKRVESVLKECGEKTLQRELISMAEDNILRKVGTKRWSRYFIV